MSLKEHVVSLLQESGFDFISACEQYETAHKAGLFVAGKTVVVGNFVVTVAS